MTEGVSDLWGTQSDWPTDPSLPKNFDAGHGADGTHRPTMHFESAPCNVNGPREGRVQCEHGVARLIQTDSSVTVDRTTDGVTSRRCAQRDSTCLCSPATGSHRVPLRSKQQAEGGVV